MRQSENTSLFRHLWFLLQAMPQRSRQRRAHQSALYDLRRSSHAFKRDVGLIDGNIGRRRR